MGAMKHSDLAGVLAVFQTPFHEDESVDVGTLEAEIDWLFDQGADGVVMAMVSETLRLSSEERDQLAAEVCRLVQGRGPVIISVGAESTAVAIRHAQHAEAAGADAVMAIPPTSVPASEDELLGYYDRILGSVAIPLIVQDASGYVGQPLSAELQARLREEFPDRVLFKPEGVPIGPRISALLDATGGQARIFDGSGGIALVDNYRRGVVGTMPGAEVIDAVVALWRALVSNDEPAINRLSPPICSLVALQTNLDAFLAIEKYLLVKRGIFKNAIVRGPVAYKLDDRTRDEVDRLFALVQQALDGSST